MTPLDALFSNLDRWRHFPSYQLERRADQPGLTEGDRCIDFTRFAEFVGRFDDPLSKHFAAHLGRWMDAAGGSPPFA